MTTVPLATNHIIYDSVSGKIFATVPASNSIVSIDPATGAVGTPIPIGSDPDAIAVSDDGQFLYVGLDGADMIQRYDIATNSMDIDFPVGTNSGEAYYAEDIKVLPGNAHAVAVSEGQAQFSPKNVGVAIFDDGIPRAGRLTPSGNDFCDTLAFSSSASTLYGADNDVDLGVLTQLAVDSNGVSLVKSTNALAPGPISFDSSSGNLLSFSGQLVAPSEPAIVGTCGIDSPQSGYDPSEPQPEASFFDSANHHIFVLLNNPSNSLILEEFDSNTYQPIGAVIMSNVYVNRTDCDLVGWGNNGLAFQTTSQSEGNVISLINGRNLPGLAGITFDHSSVVGGRMVNATVTLTTPAPPGGAIVNLSQPASTYSQSFPSSITVPAGQVSASTAIQTESVTSSVYANVIASYGLQIATADLTITDSASDPVFPPYYTVVSQRVSGIAYNSVDGLLYASVPSSNVSNGNTVVSIDPSYGTVGHSVPVGSDPGPLAVSSDGSYVWCGLEGAASLGQVNLSKFTEDLFFSLGNGGAQSYYPGQIIGLPGEPNSVVVGRLNPYVTPAGAGIAVYDGSTERQEVATRTSAESITVSSDGTTVYADGTGGYPDAISEYSITTSGITQEGVLQGILAFYGPLQYDSGQIYTDGAYVLSPNTLGPVGRFLGGGGMVVPDLENGVVYFIGNGENGATDSIEAFNSTTYAEMYTISIPDVIGRVQEAVKCGPQRLAFYTSGGEVYFANLGGSGSSNPAAPGTVYGLVQPSFSSQPLQSGTVTLTDSLTATTLSVQISNTFSGADGQNANYSLTNIPPGYYSVSESANGYNAPTTQSITVAPGSSNRVNFQPLPLHTFSPGLQMFSVPYNYMSINDNTLFGDPSYKLAYWQPDSLSYGVWAQGSGGFFSAGQGYWARFPQQVELAGPNTPVQASSFSISLAQGWNLIGNPYPTAISIDSMTVQTSGKSYDFDTASSKPLSLIDPLLFSYPAGVSSYQISTSSSYLYPYFGYWIYASKPCTLTLQ